MTMCSTDLLPALRELPTSESGQRMSFRDMMTGLVNTDRAMYAAEFASAASLGMWYIFDHRSVLGINVPGTGINVDDNIAAAYKAQYPVLAADHSLHEHWREMMERGPESMQGFINGLKGKVAEFNAKDVLEANGYTNVDLAPSSNQPGWDLHGTVPDGNYTRIQVKTGESYTASDIQEHMDKYPVGEVNYADHYAVGSEIYEKYIESGMDAGGRTLTEFGPDYALVGGTTDGLDTLSANMGIDIPDGVVDIIPYASVIVGGARLIYSVVKTEKEFKAADRTTKNKIQVVQTLTLMSRMGITTVMVAAGGMGGTAAGSAVPGIGNIVAGFGGTVVGVGMGMYLNRRLQPRMLDLALNITGLTHDDLFYYKNKQRVDAVARAFQAKAGELAAAAGF